MKRMNEVFDFERGVGYPASWSNEQVKLANHALKNVDALADALADLIASCRASGSNILACTYAEEALAAYRGKK